MERKEGQHEAGEVKVGKRWEFPVAQPKTGMLWGTVEESRGGKRILAFRGIRHLLPPVGDRRFKPPVPAPKHDDIQDVKHNGHVCPQHMATKRDTWVGDEDCLWLNVFTRYRDITIIINNIPNVPLQGSCGIEEETSNCLDPWW